MKPEENDGWLSTRNKQKIKVNVKGPTRGRVLLSRPVYSPVWRMTQTSPPPKQLGKVMYQSTIRPYMTSNKGRKNEGNPDIQLSSAKDEGNVETVLPINDNLRDENMSECKAYNGTCAIQGCTLSEDMNSNQRPDSDVNTLQEDTFDIMYPGLQVNHENQTNFKTKTRNSKQKLCSRIFSSSDSSESDELCPISSCGKRPRLINNGTSDSETFTLQWHEPRQPFVSTSETEQFILQLQEHPTDECQDSFLESTEEDVVFKKYLLPSKLDCCDHIFASTQHSESESRHDKRRHTGAHSIHEDSDELPFPLSVKNSLQNAASTTCSNIVVDSDLCFDEEDDELEDSQIMLD